jgi:hypothetical protein
MAWSVGDETPSLPPLFKGRNTVGVSRQTIRPLKKKRARNLERYKVPPLEKGR